MKTFNSMIPSYASCIREGVLNSETPVCDIVKGDIVHIQAGDIVPADIRIIESKGFKVCILHYQLSTCTEDTRGRERVYLYH